MTFLINFTISQFQKWDLIELTQKYLRLILTYLEEPGGGILVHCISGWDRTPLFISLVRLSLWADGLIHTSLSPTQILYLTIAYDWFLFGHQLEDRLTKGEEIFFFCFYFLKFIGGKEYQCNSRQVIPRCSIRFARLLIEHLVIYSHLYIKLRATLNPEMAKLPMISSHKPEPSFNYLKHSNISEIVFE